jgi:hypothetical protein
MVAILVRMGAQPVDPLGTEAKVVGGEEPGFGQHRIRR